MQAFFVLAISNNSRTILAPWGMTKGEENVSIFNLCYSIDVAGRFLWSREAIVVGPQSLEGSNVPDRFGWKTKRLAMPGPPNWGLGKVLCPIPIKRNVTTETKHTFYDNSSSWRRCVESLFEKIAMRRGEVHVEVVIIVLIHPSEVSRICLSSQETRHL